MQGHKITYVVLLSKHGDLSNAELYNATQPPLTVPRMASGYTYHVAVKLVDEHGFQSAPSPTLSVGIAGESLSIKAGSLIGVVVGVVVLLAALGLLLGFMVVRHRRLQRSFVSFANTHYDTRSGATTFTTGAENAGLGDEDDDDEPVIRGFSDDEPLVIA